MELFESNPDGGVNIKLFNVHLVEFEYKILRVSYIMMSIVKRLLYSKQLLYSIN